MRMRPPVAAHVLVVGGLEARDLVRLLRVGAHHARARTGSPARCAFMLGELRLHRLEAVVDAAAEVAHQHRDEQQRQQGEAAAAAG